MIRFRSPLNIALLVAGIIATIAGYVLVPPAAVLPVRWGFDLQPTQSMPRNLALLQMPGAALAILLIFVAVDRYGNRARQPGQLATLNWVLTGVTALLVAVQAAIVVIGVGIGCG